MSIFAPDYYKEFHCIADKCKHNCCIGWEIDIDEDTLNLYENIDGDFGNRLKENISKTDTPHFCLKENDRCPFLNKDNLCDIIINLGENALCNICADHPRYRNFFESRIEIGIGLCCEEAARLILTHDQRTEIIEIEGEKTGEIPEDEEFFFAVRNQVFEILQNRSVSIQSRIRNLIDKFDICYTRHSANDLAEIFLNLERLDESWTHHLEELKKLSRYSFDIDEFDNTFEQLLIYFIYRHLSDSLYDMHFSERLAFSILSIELLYNLLCVHKNKFGKLEIQDIIDYARMYSAEVEYSEENIETLLRLI